MGWVDELDGGIVALDTAPVIYYIESHPTYVWTLDPFFAGLRSGAFRGVTSTITLVETLTQPLRRGDAELAARYRALLLRSRGFTTTPLSPRIADESARLRAAYNLSTPDAAQIATALTEHAEYFLTNDARLSRVTELQVLVLDRVRER